MLVYVVVLFVILFNGALNRKRRRLFIVSSFGIIAIIAGLRKYTVGIDLSEHYANRFAVIANLDWDQLPSYYIAHTYDFGFLVFDKILGYISDNPQLFIIATSIIIYGSTARYVYRHSENVILETFLLMTSFTLMMYLNIIAQALAIAVILFALDFLLERKYIKYIIIVLIATSIHSSAIICLGFIPLTFFPNNKKFVIRYILILLLGLLGLNRILTFLTETVFSQYAYYFEEGSYHGEGISVSLNSLFQISMHLLAILVACVYLNRKGKFEDSKLVLLIKRRKNNLTSNSLLTIPQFTTNFLLYMAISSTVFRVLAYESYIITRMGFYFYFFSFTLLARGVTNIKSRTNRKLVVTFIYVYMLIMFFAFYKSAGINSYGVLPYQFFWE